MSTAEGHSTTDGDRELRELYPEARRFVEQDAPYVLIPELPITVRNGNTYTVDVVVCLGPRDGYSTRLFLSRQIPTTEPRNWTTAYILDRVWYAVSWRDVEPEGTPLEILAQHLHAFR